MPVYTSSSSEALRQSGFQAMADRGFRLDSGDPRVMSWALTLGKYNQLAAELGVRLAAAQAEHSDSKEVFGEYLNAADASKNGVKSITIGNGTNYTYDTTNQTGPELAVSIRKQQQFVWAEMDRRHSELARVVATLSNAMIEVLNGPLQDLIQEAVGIVGMVLTGQGLTAKPSVDLDGPDAR